ncbi:MAG: LCP family protein [Clostridia bacterium]|nr:LCP family protein [Clostridia bacterium]
MSQDKVHKHEMPRKKTTFRRKALIVILLMVIGFCAYTIWDVLKAPEIDPPPVVDNSGEDEFDPSLYEEDPNLPDDEDEDVELVRKEGVYTFVLAGTNDDYNTDTIMLGQVDANNDTATLVSIPRDTMVDVNIKYKKINNAYGRAGMDELRRLLGEVTGIYPDYYCLVNMEDFIEIVDVIGGVDFNVPYDMYHADVDPKYHIDLKAGYQTLDGKKAIQLVRFRGTSANDYGRMEIQRDFLKAVGKKMVTEFSLSQASGMIEVMAKSIETNMPVKDMIWFFINVATTMDFDTGLVFDVMPGTTTGRYNGQDYVYLDAEQTAEYINANINPYTTDIDPDDLNIIHLED